MTDSASPIPFPEQLVLIVEDDPHVRLGCVQATQLAGMAVEGVGSAEEALPRINSGMVGVVVTDMRLPKADGLSLVKYCHQQDEQLPVVMITGHGDVNLAVYAMRSGAYDFITKPFQLDELLHVLEKALEQRRLKSENAYLRSQLEDRYQFSGILGRSRRMQELFHMLEVVAATSSTVLITGETGTGKELVAHAIHHNGPQIGRAHV